MLLTQDNYSLLTCEIMYHNHPRMSSIPATFKQLLYLLRIFKLSATPCCTYSAKPVCCSNSGRYFTLLYPCHISAIAFPPVFPCNKSCYFYFFFERSSYYAEDKTYPFNCGWPYPHRSPPPGRLFPPLHRGQARQITFHYLKGNQKTCAGPCPTMLWLP